MTGASCGRLHHKIWLISFTRLTTFPSFHSTPEVRVSHQPATHCSHHLSTLSFSLTNTYAAQSPKPCQQKLQVLIHGYKVYSSINSETKVMCVGWQRLISSATLHSGGQPPPPPPLPGYPSRPVSDHHVVCWRLLFKS